MSENVKTYLRIKPQAIPDDLKITGNSIQIDNKEFCFDKIFRNSTQQEVFRELSESLLVECVQGYNCTVFAYGQTGSGKTYTIQGNSHDSGLVQRSLSFLHRNTDLKINLSFVEIYNETMLDLFDTSTSLSIREDPLKGIVVDNLTTLGSSSYEESMELYSKGIGVRKTSSTAMNKESSRSHSVFTVYLEGSNGIISRSSRLCFVDLAGSERLRDGEIEDTRLRETMNINKSLLCLGKVINKFSSGEDGHIGYRDSRLTFLLKDSLGGNCKLTVVGNISLEHRNDSLNTIHFLTRSKMIRNIAVANSDVDGGLEDVRSKLKSLDKENQSLKARLALMGNRTHEEISMLPSFCHGFKQVVELVSEVVTAFQELEKAVLARTGQDFDENKRLLMDLNSQLVSVFKERRSGLDSIVNERRMEKEH